MSATAMAFCFTCKDVVEMRQAGVWYMRVETDEPPHAKFIPANVGTCFVCGRLLSRISKDFDWYSGVPHVPGSPGAPVLP